MPAAFRGPESPRQRVGPGLVAADMSPSSSAATEQGLSARRKVIIKVPLSMRKRRPPSQTDTDTTTASTNSPQSDAGTTPSPPSTPSPRFRCADDSSRSSPSLSNCTPCTTDSMSGNTPDSTSKSMPDHITNIRPRTTQIVVVGSWRPVWLASLERQRARRHGHRRRRRLLEHRKSYLAQLYHTRDPAFFTPSSTSGPFLRHLARTNMADLADDEVRAFLRDAVMTPADYAETMIWYRRALRERGERGENEGAAAGSGR